MDSETAIRVAQAIGIGGAGYASGVIGSVSLIAIPAIRTAPPHLMSQQWRAVYDIGVRFGPAFALVAASAFGYLAYQFPQHRTAYILAAVAPLGIAPYTKIFMDSTNRLIRSRANAADLLSTAELFTETAMPKGQNTADLVAKWGTLNSVRSLFPLLGALIGAWTVFA